MFVSVIIAAGGRGTRLGSVVPKQFLTVGRRSLLEQSLEAFDRHPRIGELIVVVPPDSGSPPLMVSKPHRIVAGGERRQDSVAHGFAAVSEHADIVLIHDAARPFVTDDVIDRTIEAAAAAGAAVPAIPVHDTVKQAADDGGTRVVARTLPRETIFLAQTPQGFRREVLAAAVAAGAAGAAGTDEAMLAEQAGHVVRLVAGDERNIKITTMADLERARGERAGGATLRVGTGYDLHRLVAGRPLILGGVRIPFERGLAGHSDADAVSHAVTDALLGAANLGDIGRLFPDTDPQWKDADSLQLLAGAYARVRAAGWQVGNLDVVVIAERPKIGPHAEAMRRTLAGVLGIEPDAIAIKGKTNEGVDATGRGEAIAVHAVALLVRA